MGYTQQDIAERLKTSTDKVKKACSDLKTYYSLWAGKIDISKPVTLGGHHISPADCEKIRSAYNEQQAQEQKQRFRTAYKPVLIDNEHGYITAQPAILQNIGGQPAPIVRTPYKPIKHAGRPAVPTIPTFYAITPAPIDRRHTPASPALVNENGKARNTDLNLYEKAVSALRELHSLPEYTPAFTVTKARENVRFYWKQYRKALKK